VAPDETLLKRLPVLSGLTADDMLAGNASTQNRLAAFMASVPDYTAPAAVQVHDDLVPGPHGSVRLRIYSAPASSATSAAAQRPGLVCAHGGGFGGGGLAMPETGVVARELVTRAGAVVVSVDYRLAIRGTHFPVPRDDVMAAWSWVVDHAHEYAVGPARLFLGGASAGACLAASAALQLRDEGGVRPVCLLLAYSLLHAELPEPSASLDGCMRDIPAALRFTAAGVRRMTAQYIGPGTVALGAVFPGHAALAGLAPVLMITS
jgi:acetyl esterase